MGIISLVFTVISVIAHFSLKSVIVSNILRLNLAYSGTRIGHQATMPSLQNDSEYVKYNFKNQTNTHAAEL